MWLDFTTFRSDSQALLLAVVVHAVADHAVHPHAVDVAEQTMRALHDLVHAPPAEVDAHASLMAARGLSCAMLRRLGEVSAGPRVRTVWVSG